VEKKLKLAKITGQKENQGEKLKKFSISAKNVTIVFLFN